MIFVLRLVAVCEFVVLLSACGGGAPPTSPPETNTPTTLPSASPAPSATPTPQNQISIDASQTGELISRDLLGAQSPYYLTDYTQPNDANAFAAIPLHYTTYGDNGYHWQQNTWCSGSPTQGLPPGGSTINPGNPNGTFDLFMTDFAEPDHLDVLIHVPVGTNPTCNGRALPSEAAAWVNHSNNVEHYGVKLWELGLYPSDADNDDFGSPPYMADSPTTYASIANTFYSAMKAQDPTIEVGVDLSPPIGTTAPSSSWDTAVLANANADFVIFPISANTPTNSGDPSDYDLLYNSPTVLRTALGVVKNELANSGKPNLPVFLDVMEGNDAQRNTQQTNSIVTALYFGMALGEVMDAGFSEATMGYGGCSAGFTTVPGEYGSTAFADPFLISNGAGCPIPDGTILPQGTVFQLASQFALAGEHALSPAVTDMPNVRAYAATQGSGYALLLFNLDQNNAITAPIALTHTARSTFSATTLTYGNMQYEAGMGTPPIGASLGSVGTTFSVPLPPWSVTVVKLQ